MFANIGVCESLSKQWNEAYKENNEKLQKEIEKECWFLRLYSERYSHQCMK